MDTGWYESWFVSARDPASPRALWIRHTRLRTGRGAESAALWCTVVDRDLGAQPFLVKQVSGTFPPGVTAGAGQFRGEATQGDVSARWDLAVTDGQPPLRPLRPAALYRAPLPRTKLEATVPDGVLTGTLSAGGHRVAVDGWRGTVGRNWGTEHADTWVWLHAAGFGAAPGSWLELVLARVRIGPLRSPWTAMGALSAGGELIPLGGLGRRPAVSAGPRRLAAGIPSPGARLDVEVTAGGHDTVAVNYAGPHGGNRAVSHAARATVRLVLRRRGHSDLTMTGTCGAYEYGTSRGLPGMTLRPLPEG